jgi:hypothetical protein
METAKIHQVPSEMWHSAPSFGLQCSVSNFIFSWVLTTRFAWEATPAADFRVGLGPKLSIGTRGSGPVTPDHMCEAREKISVLRFGEEENSICIRGDASRNPDTDG